MAAFRSSSCLRNSLRTLSLNRRNSSFRSRTISKSSSLPLGLNDSRFISTSIDFMLCSRTFPVLSTSPSTSAFSVAFRSSLGSLLLERSRDSPRRAAMANSSWEQLLLLCLMMERAAGQLLASRAGENLLGRSRSAPKIRDSTGLFFRTACFQFDLDSDLLPYISYTKSIQTVHEGQIHLPCGWSRDSFSVGLIVIENYYRMKLVNALFKEDPLTKELKRLNLTTDSLLAQTIGKSVRLFEEKSKEGQEEVLLKALIKQLEEKCSSLRKLKVMMTLIEISKVCKYDICDIILNKKIKAFTKPSKFKHNEIEPKPQNLESFVCEELLIPLYNYLMKLSTNEELYNTCRQGEIPYDDIFRRGSKIRFIWIFKLYNIINLLLPILHSLQRMHQLNPTLAFLNEAAAVIFNDVALMNNFVVKALEEASTDNFILMPYFDMLQFHESLKEQIMVGRSVRELYESVRHFTHDLMKPLPLSLKKEEMEEIELQALRVKLISNSLKNPKKDHTVLETEYNQKFEKKERLYSQPNFTIEEDFTDKYRNLD